VDSGFFPRPQGKQDRSGGDHPWKMNNSRIVLEAQRIVKYFHDPLTFRALDSVSFSVGMGEFISVTGKSGCGKSTLLYILSTMDSDFEGELFIDGQPMKSLDQQQLAQVRNEKIGFVFQFHYLLTEFSVIQNVMLPGLKLGKYSEPEVLQRAMHHLDVLGIADQASKPANQLSGGQKQRVAIARALINDPLIIMGDEPTGNLDSRNSETVFRIFSDIASRKQQSLLIVTHDEDFAKRTDRIIAMDDGKIL
jgi:lipoprotein-releasing system ATP-binding protein